jgi:hypothetical protein
LGTGLEPFRNGNLKLLYCKNANVLFVYTPLEKVSCSKRRLLVEWLRARFRKEGDTPDKSTKFGHNIPYGPSSDFQIGAKQNRPQGQSYGPKTKWPPVGHSPTLPSKTNLHKIMILVSKHMFFRARNPFLRFILSKSEKWQC